MLVVRDFPVNPRLSRPSDEKKLTLAIEKRRDMVHCEKRENQNATGAPTFL